ncbi:hypothetical protein SAMN05216188_101925 [Lentzea xinjiangensis]|uniref:Orc1-like AAA ATPase domain-containing protein n=1 Tax=Lentzea xinjiangensis TaxID=402600 RepID=A0A1H9BV95_9PSEU|nr:ATP-binding protein [Lentzea xinjiangensis]SEP92268.1 hypothetical protein SAMN05216188_101925 [Lentzea xinjiangensis]
MAVTSSVVSDRERELAVLRGALEEAAAGAPAAVCVEGAVGTGKSAVLGETARTARELGFEVFRVQCSGTASRLRFGLLDEAIGGAADRRLHRLVHEVSAGSPVLVAVDDVERADEPSLRFLLHLRGRLGRLPVAFVVTRGLAAAGGPLLRAVIGDARPVRLTGLDRPACARFLCAVLGREVTGEVVTEWREATGGNPYLLRLRARDLGERAGELVARLALAGPRVLALARASAVLGEADPALAGAVAGLTPHEAVEASRTLTGMGFAGVPMVFSTLAQSTTASERAAVHARAARFRHDERAPAEEVAAHVLEAAPIGEEWVREVLLTCARQSTSDRAVVLLRRLLREPLPDAVRGEVLVELAERRSSTRR